MNNNNKKQNPAPLASVVSDDTPMYRDWWYILEELPKGWVIDKRTGSPVFKTYFITNGKNALSGEQEKALLKFEPKEYLKKNQTIQYKDFYVEKIKENPKNFIYPAKTVNDLARLKFTEQLLKDIRIDLMICEIEKWDKKEYVNELKKIINSIDI